MRLGYLRNAELQTGAKKDAVLEIVERALIDHFTEAGDALINKLGSKLPVNVIQFDGNLLARRRSGRLLRVPKHRQRGGDVDSSARALEVKHYFMPAHALNLAAQPGPAHAYPPRPRFAHLLPTRGEGDDRHRLASSLTGWPNAG